MRWIAERIKSPIYAEISAKLAENVNIPVMLTGDVRNLDEINEILNKSKIQYV